MAGMHNIWDWQAYNRAGARVEAYHAMVFGANAEEADLPAGANASNFAGILTAPANNNTPATMRRVGMVNVKVSGTVHAGSYGYISGVDGRVAEVAASGTPGTYYAVCMFERDGVANDLVVASVIFPAMQVTL